MRPILVCVLALALFGQDQTGLSRALASSRQRIDHIDDQIVKLLNERATVVREVGIVKTRFHAPATSPGREEEVLNRVSESSARAAFARSGPQDLPNSAGGDVGDGRP